MDSDREQTCSCYKGAGIGWEGKKWEFGTSKGKLLYIEWVDNKVLLYSTQETSIQYPVVTHNGKDCEKNMKKQYI